MRPLIFLLLQLLVFVPLISGAAESGAATSGQNDKNAAANGAVRARVINSYGRLPLYFVENRGQLGPQVRYYEKGAGHATFFTPDGLVLSLSRGSAEKAKSETFRLSLAGADKDAEISATGVLPGRVNYFSGSDRTKWAANIPTYSTVTYKNAYRGIDVKFYGTGGKIEHDVVVRPGADPSKVRFSYKGVNGLKVTEDGDLVISLEDGEIIEKKPIVYQVLNGRKVQVESSYRLLGKKDGAYEYAFNVASYDRSKDLVIDPVLDYSTYLGGSGADTALAIAVDSTGAAYVTGSTFSPDFPVTGALQGASAGAPDVFVTKINPTGTALVYSTYLGGTNLDQANAIAVDSAGNVYVTGFTSSADFPTASPINAASAGGNDIFLTKIDPTGAALVYSTYIGGTTDDIANGLAIDAAGNVFITGSTSSVDFPVLGAIQGATGGVLDAFVTEVNSAGTALVFSTYLGGSADDVANGLALDTAGNIYVTGNSKSIDFPLVSPIQAALADATWGDVFITKIASGGAAINYSTYLGGTLWDAGNAITTDASGNAYVTGFSNSVDFPVASAIQSSLAGNNDVILVKVDPTGAALVFSTYIGGTDWDSGSDIALAQTGEIYLTGVTWSPDYPVASAIQSTMGGVTDAFVTEVDGAGAAIMMSTYLGGSDAENGNGLALDASGNVYVAGDTKSLDFPTDVPIQGANAGGVNDAFVARISSTAQPVVVLTLTPDSTFLNLGATLGYTVTATNTTDVQQCFNYWENFTLPTGVTYPPQDITYGPIRLCLAGMASKVAHLTHGIPLNAPIGTYMFNAYLGAYLSQEHPVLVDEDHFNFDVGTVMAPARK
jgi:hypothetical protein